MTDTPDFDSMSPEEMMKWMESLAARQGVTEGLTTSADMEVAEVAEDDERLEGMEDYVPFGWKKEDWEAHLAKEEAEKAAKQAAAPAPPPPPPPAPEPEPVAAAPEPEPAPAAASADAGGDMPDFDSMSPEEMMKWMESLAVRQGATEGMTTSADMQVAEVAADDKRLEGVEDYVPFGWKKEDWEAHLAKEAAEKAAKQAAAPASPPPPPPAPEPEPEPEAVPAAPSLDDLFGGQANNELPELDLSALEEVAAPAAENPMDWLEGLASAESDSGELDLDLSALGDLAAPEPAAEAAGQDDPMEWLSGLAADDSMPELAGMGDDSEEGSLAWMESLAASQGASGEELVTDANLDIPLPEGIIDDGPGYEEFSFEQGSGVITDSEELEPIPSFDVAEMDMDDPESWLENLASSQADNSDSIPSFLEDFDPDGDDLELDLSAEENEEDFDAIRDDVKSKLDSGTASPEEIEKFFMHAFDKAADRDVPDYIETDDEEDEEESIAPVQAEIPDWLQEQMSSVPEIDEAEADAAAEAAKKGTAEMMIKDLGLDEGTEDESVDIPDWLSGEAEDSGVITEDIFDELPAEDPEPATPAPVSVTTPGVRDTTDTWVQAFDSDGETLEEWYEGKIAEIGDDIAPAAEAAPEPAEEVTPAAAAPAGGLQVADLPIEATLEEGQPQSVPDWLSGEEEPAAMPEAVAAFVSDGDDDMDWLNEGDSGGEGAMPDWLADGVDDTVTADVDLPDWLSSDEGELDLESAEDVPDWLRETVDEGQEIVTPFDEAPAAPPPAPAAVPAPAAPAPVAVSPAPTPVVPAADVAAALQSAQQKVSGGDIDGALVDFESVVRANQALDQVEKALRKLADDKAQKKNAGIYRVLGDTLMRSGQLQEALETYRKALNLL